MKNCWFLEEKTLNPEKIAVNETLFCTANGYLGVRGNFEERLPDNIHCIRGTYINGVYEIEPLHYDEKFPGYAETTESQAERDSLKFPFKIFRIAKILTL